MNLERRIERLERSRPVSDEKRVRAIFICSTEEPGPTDEEIKIAEAEFIEKYDKPSMLMVDFVKGITSTRWDGEYIELPHSSKLRQLRQKRINNMVIIQPSQ